DCLQFGAQNLLVGSFLKGFGRDDAGEIYILIDSSIGPSGTDGTVSKITKAKTVMGRPHLKANERQRSQFMSIRVGFPDAAQGGDARARLPNGDSGTSSD